MFYLNREQGIDFAGGEPLAPMYEYLQDKIPKFITQIIKTDCSFYSNTSDTVAGLISEGQELIRKLFKVPNFQCITEVSKKINPKLEKQA